MSTFDLATFDARNALVRRLIDASGFKAQSTVSATSMSHGVRDALDGKTAQIPNSKVRAAAYRAGYAAGQYHLANPLALASKTIADRLHIR